MNADKQTLELFNSANEMIFRGESVWTLTAIRFLMCTYQKGDYTINVMGDGNIETYKVQMTTKEWIFDDGAGDILTLDQEFIDTGVFRFHGVVMGFLDGHSYKEFLEAVPGVEIWHRGWRTIEPVLEANIVLV